MRELMGVVNALAGDIPDDHGEGGIAFSFDTAGLRSNVELTGKAGPPDLSGRTQG